ncbi:MAG: FAD-binding protein [Clostridiales bacterium]|nr:FAD-binding protein [Clostridiales bacterium]
MNEEKQTKTRRVSGLKLSLKEVAREEDMLRQRAASALGVAKSHISELKIHKKSLDARARTEPFFLYSVDVSIVSRKREGRVQKTTAGSAHMLPAIKTEMPLTALPPLVVGAGPAGLFAALALAETGYSPLLIEQGQRVEQRLRDVESFWQGGRLDESSNVQYGEGGAGTFSDGKLTFRGKDPLARQVLKTLVELGAPPDILYWHKPHLGSDKLRELLPLLRDRILAAGGRIIFAARVDDIILRRREGRQAIEGLMISGANAVELHAQAVIFAPGNGARATFRMLSERGVALCAKPFSVGFRIEHSQSLIDAAQYGPYAGHPALPPADYMLKYRSAEGRSFYSFCMCPGGRIVNAASEEGALVTNGISLAARASGWANSALTGAVTPGKDFADDPVAALNWQRGIEQAAYAAGGGDNALPACPVEDFLNGTVPGALPQSFAPLSPAARPADLRGLLPEALTEGLAAAIRYWDRHIKGFASQAVLAAPESRTSSPVRILRGPDGQSLNIRGLYPAGEGAGYAGGILSSACDGLRAAAALREQYAPPIKSVY